jgi:dihydrofolate reductase
MGKIVLFMSVSLDGLIAGPDGDLGWHRVDEELHEHFNEVLRGMSAFVSGRVTHELMADFWPMADGDPENAGPMADFAGIWRDMPKIVYSRTADFDDWNTTVVREVVPDEVRELKSRYSGDLALGGADLAAEFLRHDLIDEYRIYVHPVIVGRGKPLFASPAPHHDLSLVETRTFGNDVTLLRYRRH